MEILKQSLFELKELLNQEKSNETVSELEPNPENPVGGNLAPENLVPENPVPENPIFNEIVSDSSDKSASDPPKTSNPENTVKKEKKKKKSICHTFLPNNRRIIYFCSETACDGAFWESRELFIHSKECHPKSLPYTCSNCLESFFMRDFNSHRKKCKKRFGKKCEMQKNIGRKSNMEHAHMDRFWELWLKGETLGRIGKIICCGNSKYKWNFIPLNLKVPKSKSISENPVIEEEAPKSTEKPVDPQSSNTEKSVEKNNKKLKSKQNENPYDFIVPAGKGRFYFCVESACDAAFWKREKMEEHLKKYHPASVPYSCSNCLQPFFYRGYTNHAENCEQKFQKRCKMQTKSVWKDGIEVVHSNRTCALKRRRMSKYWESYSKGDKLGRIGENVFLGSERENDQGKMYSEMEGFITLNIM